MIENFTTFTEVDSASDITISANTISVDTMQANANSSVYRDFGADAIGDFEHRFSIVVSAIESNTYVAAWHLSNIAAATQQDIIAAAKGLYFQIRRASTLYYFALLKSTPGGRIADYFSFVVGTTYYVRIIKDALTVRALFYSDPGFSVLLGSVDIDSDPSSFRYLGAVGSQDTSGTQKVSFSISDLNSNWMPTMRRQTIFIK